MNTRIAAHLMCLVATGTYPTRDLIINLFDSTGNIIEQWKIFDAKLTAVDFGQLDYASNMVCTIALSIDYRDFELVF